MHNLVGRMFISFKLFSLLHTRHFSCHGVLGSGDWHLIHESENSLRGNLDGLDRAFESASLSRYMKILIGCISLENGGSISYRAKLNCVCILWTMSLPLPAFSVFPRAFRVLVVSRPLMPHASIVQTDRWPWPDRSNET